MLNDLKILLFKIIFTFNDTGALSVTNAAALFSDTLVGGLWQGGGTKFSSYQTGNSLAYVTRRTPEGIYVLKIGNIVDVQERLWPDLRKAL